MLASSKSQKIIIPFVYSRHWMWISRYGLEIERGKILSQDSREMWLLLFSFMALPRISFTITININHGRYLLFVVFAGIFIKICLFFVSIRHHFFIISRAARNICFQDWNILCIFFV
jgi:hypothetical protein